MISDTCIYRLISKSPVPDSENSLSMRRPKALPLGVLVTHEIPYFTGLDCLDNRKAWLASVQRYRSHCGRIGPQYPIDRSGRADAVGTFSVSNATTDKSCRSLFCGQMRSATLRTHSMARNPGRPLGGKVPELEVIPPEAGAL